MQSLQSETNSYSTAPTSLNNSPVREAHNHSDSGDEAHDDDCGNVCVVEPDDWFAQFRSDSPDLSISSSDECPDRATLASVGDIPLYSSDGSSKPFSHLYSPDHATHQRQLVVFVRHFYCGACQAYLKALTQAIPLSSYFSIPTPTSIIVIGCGRPNLIPFYKAVTGCPFPIYADPSRQIFKKLGMTLSMDIGSKRPEYMKDISPAAWAAGQVKTIRLGLKANVRPMKRLQKRGGSFDMVSANLEQERASAVVDTAQASGVMSRSTTSGSLAKEIAVDGPVSKSSPSSPARASIKSSSTQSASKASQTSSSSGEDLKLRKRDVIRGGNPFQIGGEFLFEEGQVVWCHRMRNYRNHAEVGVIRKLLDLDD